MRRPLKPFTVEIKKSRKSADDARAVPLMPELVPLDMPAPPRSEAMASAERLFRQATVPADAGESAALSAANARAAERILPDLTWQARQPAPDPEIIVAAAEPAIRGPRKPRAAKPKPVKLDFGTGSFRQDIARPAAPMARPQAYAAEKAAEAPRAPRVRRDPARTTEVAFARGDRWKRRLPRALW